MSYEEQERPMAHRLCLEQRRQLTVSGVKEVLSFDERQVVADTVRGELTIQGSGLKVDKLDKENGELRMSGEVEALSYAEEREPGSFWRRLWNG